MLINGNWYKFWAGAKARPEIEPGTRSTIRRGGKSLAKTERKLAAIMLADIADYSALMEREETRTFARLHELREQIVNPTVAEYGGRIVK